MNLLSPRLEKVIFTSMSVDRSLGENGMLAQATKGEFTLAIAGELEHAVKHPSEDRWFTVGVMQLVGSSTDEASSVDVIKTKVVANAYFKHPVGVKKEDVQHFNKDEENLVRLLMQVYPTVLRRLISLVEDAGITGIKIPLGMPPRSQRLTSQSKKKIPLAKKTKPVSKQ